MIDYTEQDAFTTTQIYDLSDLVKGGINGLSNTPIKALLDRTAYLKNRLYRYDSSLSVQASQNIDNSVVGKVVNAKATNANVVITLDTLSNFDYGYVLPITAACSAGKNITVQAAVNQIIWLNSNYTENMVYMHDGEVLFLLRDIGMWTVIAYKGNFERVGECVSSYVQLPGTLIRQGGTGALNRADYPRLWKWINEKLTYNQQRIPDATWLSDPGGKPIYRGCFSTGNGTTTFRLPDDRGMFDRYLDLNRGMDNGRLFPYAGGYEEDLLREHYHSITTAGDARIDDTTNGYIKARQNEDNLTETQRTGKAIDAFGAALGGSETRPKKNAKLPLIIY